MILNESMSKAVTVSSEKLEGDLVIPSGTDAIILFAHGSGSSRHSTRNQFVAKVLNDAGFATLLVDLLVPQEKEIDEKTRHLRFDIDLLARRFVAVTQWLQQDHETKNLKIGYFGSSTGAAAALISAAKLKDLVETVVCRGGRPDLVDANTLERIMASTLLIVGGNDTPVIALNKSALKHLSNSRSRELAVIPDAGHLFEEPGKMEEVAKLCTEWFASHLHGNGSNFTNRYRQKASLSALKDRSHFQVRFRDRAAAGDMLTLLLSKYGNTQGITVIGIPRGGVIVAERIARKLDADFDIIIPRKLRAPDNSENAIGAIMQDGSIYIDRNRVESMSISREYLEKEQMEQKKEINRRMNLYRTDPKEYDIKGRTVILVDDGAATGATLIAAARWIKKQEPRLLVIGVPVVPQHVMSLLRAEADQVEAITVPPTTKFRSVEYFYQDFSPIGDKDVIQILRE